MFQRINTLIFLVANAISFLGSESILAAELKLPPPSTNSDFYDYGENAEAKQELGRLLFYDKILSGNLNISCATCHHSLTGTTDGLSLPVGEGGRGLGVTRDSGSGEDRIHERVPRNSPHVFNLGAKEFEVMFHDGRVAVEPSRPSGYLSPAGDELPDGLDNVLAVQALFPVTSATEMAGQAGENPQADFAAAGNLPGVWNFIAEKIKNIPEYVSLIKKAYGVEKEDISYVQIANALATFEAMAWRFDNSPFDQYLRGDKNALSNNAKKGLELFYGKAKCASCHSGTFQTDHKFYSIAMPQVGPGKGDGEGHEDFGRAKVTKKTRDRYRFRTPTLRNVKLTGPWGHAGAYNSLEAVIEHHINPIRSLMNYDLRQLVMPKVENFLESDFMIMNDIEALAKIAKSSQINMPQLSKTEIQDILTFLDSLTDTAAFDMRNDVPARLPSGLPVAD